MRLRKGFLLTQAVLTSTLFISGQLLADQISQPIVDTSEQTSATSNNILEITPTGQISNSDGSIPVQIDTDNGRLFVDANNSNAGGVAIETTGGNLADTVQVSNPGAGVSIGVNSVVSSNMDGIYVSGANASANIVNSGKIVADSSAIRIDNNASATVLDYPSGVLTGSTTQQAATFLLTNLAGVSSSLQNEGLIQAQGTNDALDLGSNMTQVINWGTISAINPTNATIFVTDPITITDGVVNYGNITNVTNGYAVNLSQASTTLYQNNGTISGLVILPLDDANSDGNIFVMNGGTITGDVTSSNNQSNTLQLNGGTLSSNLILGTLGDAVELNGGTVFSIQGGVGNDTVDVTGGNIVNSLAGGDGTNTLNINTTFSTNATIDEFGININYPGTVFTANGLITNLTSLTINSQTTFIDNAQTITGQNGVIGTINNNGLMEVIGGQFLQDVTLTNNNASVLQLNVDSALTLGTSTLAPPQNLLTLNPDAVIAVELGGPGAYGQINVIPSTIDLGSVGNTVTLAQGSFIAPEINGFIPAGETFNIINDANANGGGGIIDNGVSIIQPDSVTLSFSTNYVQDQGGNNIILQLLTNRTPYNALSSSAATQNVSAALDVLARGVGPSDPDLLSLFWHLDLDSTQEAIEADMESLVPPYNYGLIEGSHLGMELVFNGLEARLGDLQWARRAHTAFNNNGSFQVAQNGLNYGDSNSRFGAWIKALGGYADQHDRDSAPGYKASAGGGAIGVDWGLSDTFVLGLAGSFTKVSVDGKGSAPKDQGIKSYQGTVYGWYEPFGALFVDGMFGIAREDINTDRVITAGSLLSSAQASFNGTQFGGQADVGYDFMKDTNCFFAPIVRMKYIHLELDDYTENGAGGASLTVHNENEMVEFAGGAGLRVGMMLDEGSMVYVPELSAILSYDFKVDAEQTLANFVGGGPAFATPGVRPGRTYFDLGLGLNVYSSTNSIFSISYDLQLREEFIGNSGYLQYYYRW